MSPGVELIGRFEGSGLKEDIYLARRNDGQVIQMSSLLFAVAGQIDGTTDVEGIAAGVSAQLGRLLEADDVAFLIDTKLRPAGIIAGAGEAEAQLARADPLLGLRFRARVIPAALVIRAANVLAPLLHPAFIVAVLIGLAAFDAWFLFLHGMAQAVREVVLQPHWTLVVLALLLASTALHELGHAAACRYGGAKPGPIGVGLYLAWPVFYSDVTDSYRLGRNARLRTDLGGVYFNLVFSVVIAAFYMATGFEPLLIVIALIQIEVLHQFFPFFRLDGYYVASDLIGVPDLFARLRPTLASLIPGRPLHPQVAALRPWARVAVAVWVLTTLAVVLLLYVLLVLGTPRLLATAWESFGLHGQALGMALARADVLGVLLALIEELLLALPLVALMLTVLRVARHLLLAWWSLGERQPVLRAAVAVATVLAASVAAGAFLSPLEYQPIRPDERGTLPAPAAAQALPVPPYEPLRRPSPIRPPASSPSPVTATAAPPAASAAPASPLPSASAATPAPSPAVSPSLVPSPTTTTTPTPTPAASPS